MAGIHHESLLVGHLAEILHGETVLCPVLEYGTVAAVYDELVWMLSHGRVKVVLYHQHDGGSLLRFVRILVYRTGVHLVARTIAVHIYTAVLMQLLHEFRSELLVQMLREIAQGIAQGEALLLGSEDVLALRGVVYLFVIRHRLRQCVGDADSYLFLEFFCCHNDMNYVIGRIICLSSAQRWL